MTNVDFARAAAFLAKYCADWAGDNLCIPEWNDRPMYEEAADRFIAHIRERLAYIEAETRGAHRQRVETTQ
jgi:hypothetical protein